MSLDLFYILDPYNDEQLKKITLFEKGNNLSGIVDSINEIRSIPKEDYLNRQKVSNDVDQILFIEKEDKIVECCFLEGKNDLKKCSIIEYDTINKSKKRKLPILATEYALNNLNMEEVLVEILPEDIVMQEYLNDKGYECIGDVNNKIVYLKDREEKEKTSVMG